MVSPPWRHRRLEYEAPAGIDPATIPGHDAAPEVRRVQLSDGNLYESLPGRAQVTPALARALKLASEPSAQRR
jgi:hypothetical protein